MARQLTEELKLKIEERIKQLETRSSLEFVSLVSDRSSSYHFFKLSLALTLAFMVFALYVLREAAQTFELSLVISLGIGLAFYFLLSWAPLFRLLAPRRLLLSEVVEAAHSHFLSREIFATQKRCGILIYISELERAVYILADKGVSPYLRAEEWAALGNKLAIDLSSHGAGDTFLRALEELFDRLSPNFPPQHNDQNELPNKVVSAIEN